MAQVWSVIILVEACASVKALLTRCLPACDKVITTFSCTAVVNYNLATCSIEDAHKASTLTLLIYVHTRNIHGLLIVSYNCGKALDLSVCAIQDLIYCFPPIGIILL